MLTVQTLREYGANVDEGLKRCMNNEMFYLRLVKMALADTHFESLRAAVNAGDLQAAFESAHSLKGVLTNLALTPLATTVSEVTELLRARTEADYGAYMKRIDAEYAALKALEE